MGSAHPSHAYLEISLCNFHILHFSIYIPCEMAQSTKSWYGTSVLGQQAFDAAPEVVDFLSFLVFLAFA